MTRSRRGSPTAAFALFLACTPRPSPGSAEPTPAPPPTPAPTLALAPAPASVDPDGDDDPPDPTDGPPPVALRFERVGRAPLALQRICDLTSFGDGLFAAHANQPLGTDGATISVYRDTKIDGGTPPSKGRMSVAFDWNRPGEPTRGGGAGQGFLRVHAIGGRLFVPDADPPYAGFGLVDHGTEGYVFVSDALGNFAPARSPGHLPPAAPSATSPGAGVVPRAYHVIDVIRYRGRMYASTGSVPPTEHAWRGPSPGALHIADEGDRPLARWTYAIDYPFPWQPGVWRLTYMVRFRGRLYVGIADYDRQDPNDYVVFSPPPGVSTIARDDERAVRVTRDGAAMTLRWFADAGELFWIALERDGRVVLRETHDGDTWTEVPLPPDAGRPTDVTTYRAARVVLTERGLWRIDGAAPVEIARVQAMPSPFGITDAFCAAPLAVHRGALYAGGQRDGSLWRLAPASDAGE